MPNQLIHARSPYLLQHANNPVAWMPWGAEALQHAKEQSKLMIVSVGYSACHWCHVMEHESFEDQEVADLMNAYFVSIKVDREERPDVDQVYMNAAMLINGNGGWPLNAIALPDGRPVYAGTYYPKANWLRILAYFADLWQKNPEKLLEQAENLTNGIRKLDHAPAPGEKVAHHKHLLNVIWQHWKPQADMEYGGRKGAPKFMMPNQYDFLLKYHYSSGDPEIREFIETTLHRMALGGLNDQLAGGFTRYSTDPYWKVPHFEKMLYDNGQLLSIYAQAFRHWRTPLYEEVLKKTISWLDTEMKAPDGGYYAALDADSEGEEGKFYVFIEAEIDQVIGKQKAQWLKDYYDVKPYGNWEHGNNVLHAVMTPEAFAAQKNIDPARFRAYLEDCHRALLQARSGRIRPGLDDKRISGWNALLLNGFVQTYFATTDETVLQRAIDLASFLNTTMKKADGGLWHTFNKGTAYIEGYLSDYAPAIFAFVQLYQATLDDRYLRQAYEWMQYCVDHFYDEESGLFFLTSDDAETLVSRPRELSDNVISSSNAILARAMLQLSHYFEKPVLREMADVMLQHVLQDALRNGPFYAEWASLLWEFIYPPYELALTDEVATEQVKEIYSHYLPHSLVFGPSAQIPLMEGKSAPFIYVCRNFTCLAPVKDVAEIFPLALSPES